jgi:ankyrin repeat protein
VLIHDYVSDGNLEGVIEQLAKNIEIDVRDEETDLTPLMYAVTREAAGLEMVQLLIDRGADPNAVGGKQVSQSVLSRAIETGSLAKIAGLIDAGARFSFERRITYHAAMDAVLVRYFRDDPEAIRIIEHLTERGTRYGGARDRGDSGIGYASFAARFDIVKVLLDGGTDPATLQWTPLMRAIALGSLDDVRAELDKGADLAARDSCRRTPWLLSLDVGDTSKSKLILEAGAELTERGPSGTTPLMYPIANGDVEMLRWLLSKGLDVSDADEIKRTPLQLAITENHPECVKLLLNAGAYPNERDQYGETPLMNARCVAVVESLLNAGADINAVEGFGDDAVQYFLSGECDSEIPDSVRFEIVDALLAAGADKERFNQGGDSRLYSASFGHHDEAVIFLLKRGVDVHPSSSGSGTALHGICWQGEYSDPEVNVSCERIIEALVQAGLDPNVSDSYGKTPMHEAADGDWGNETAIRTLLRLGGLPDPVDGRGNSPLLLAADCGHVECVRELLEAGANPLKKNNDGKTPLDAAREHLSSWESIVARGPDDPQWADETDPRTDEEQKASLQEALEKAHVAFDLIEQAIRG